MEILNWKEQPAGSKDAAIFDVAFPGGIQLTLEKVHQLKVAWSKTGSLYVKWPKCHDPDLDRWTDKFLWSLESGRLLNREILVLAHQIIKGSPRPAQPYVIEADRRLSEDF